MKNLIRLCAAALLATTLVPAAYAGQPSAARTATWTGSGVISDGAGSLGLKTTICDNDASAYLTFILSGTAASYARISVNGGAEQTMTKTSTGKNQSNWKYTYTSPTKIAIAPLVGNVVAVYNGKEIGTLTVGSGCLGAEMQIVTGGHHNCVIFKNASVKCWGANNFGQLGMGDTANRGDGPDEMGASLPTVNLGTGRKAKALAAGEWHSCALLDDGSVKCWGLGMYGQLGSESTASLGDNGGEMGDSLLSVNLGTGRTAKALTAGSGFTCAILDNGSVKCWGDNQLGQLGLGDTSRRGDSSGSMGDNLPAVALGTGRTAQAIESGVNHTCVILDNNDLKCWGYNGQGQLGYGNTTWRGDSSATMGDNLPAVDLGTGLSAVSVTAGGQYTCALLSNSTVKCWGWNIEGELGIGSTTARGDNGGEMGDSLQAVDFGSGRTPRSIFSGYQHVCALLDDSALKCWGRNDFGQLGTGDTNSRGDAANEMGDFLLSINLGTGRTALSVSLGLYHSCAILDNGTVKCWGDNRIYGALGQGDLVIRGDQANEMGDNLPAISL